MNDYSQETEPPPDGKFYRVGFDRRAGSGEFIPYSYYALHSDALSACRSLNVEQEAVNYRIQKWFNERWVRVYE